ncbi:MAG: sodium:solute symporter [Flavobacteriaceae bacterium]|jgi:SSS family solute:Na+ symporter|nr:sodium:solute symporter [Flavobacteriaceae bacterium]|tara:strand:+ start:4292 stop:5950 length:1659 start_codon:yes stop_codon:yes gene_type:complete
MHQDDWIILISTILFIVIYGAYKTRKNKNIQSFLKGNNTSNWFTIGISVMATQASAITFLSTPGQAYYDGMGFLQFYLGLPLAMIIICMFFVPLYHKLKVYTAYEFLENRFDRKTRTLGAILFLIQRGLAAGITIFAPSIILSTVLGIDLKILNFLVGFLVIVYTVTGGTKAVNITQKQQMFVIFLGLFFVFFFLIERYPENLTVSKFLEYSRSSEKFKILDFSIDPNNRYTFWSGITGGLFLALSYFGTDQSQVQRYISGKSVKEIRLGLIFNGIFKIPMQFFILLLGVMVFVFFEFNKSPVNYNPQVISYAQKNYSSDFNKILNEYEDLTFEKRKLQQGFLSNDGDFPIQLNSIQKKEKELRTNVKELVSTNNNSIEENDKDYVFLHFILNYLPKGLIGLLIAVIICAAMSSTASELNALAATTTIDLYKRNHQIKKSERHYLSASKFFTVMWGIIAIVFASFGTLFENLIQLVNIIGSIFYGTILGIFLVAFFFKKITSNSVFWSACLSQIIIFIIFFTTDISYLWLNFIGAFITVVLSNIIERFKLIV